MVTVDLTRDEHGCLHSRLLNAVQGRSGKGGARTCYGKTVRDVLPDGVAVLDAFHVVKLADN